MNKVYNALYNGQGLDQENVCKSLKRLAGAAGFEPATYGFGDRLVSSEISGVAV